MEGGEYKKSDRGVVEIEYENDDENGHSIVDLNDNLDQNGNGGYQIQPQLVENTLLTLNEKTATIYNTETEKRCYKSAISAYAICQGAIYSEISLKNCQKGFKVGIFKSQNLETNDNI